jgi:uncharacterized protein YjbI with pentapeptide repeats
MLKRWAAWPPGIRWLVGIAAVVLAVAIVWALFVPLADWLARHDVGSAKPELLQTARDAARGRLLTLSAGLLAAGALVFTARNFILSREGHVTDRYTKAIEQLGSKELDVRIGGIYALERIARDSAKDHPTVMEVLTAFIREHSREPWPPPDVGSSGRTAAAPLALSSMTGTQRPARTVRYLAARASSSTGPPEQERLTRPDVQAAVRVVMRRDAHRDILPIDLTRADLSGADLARLHLADVATGADFRIGADLGRAILRGANLRSANLRSADLTDANLDGADLAGAWLSGAALVGAYLRSANLRWAHLDANLRGADLTDANLSSANLDHANLTGAHLDGADLTYARLRAQLSGATLTGADLTSAALDTESMIGTVTIIHDADLTGVKWPEGARVPGGWMVDSDSGRLKRAGGLSEVTAHCL